MKFPFYIAKRYLFAKKSHNLINILSGISVAGVVIGTMSLVIVLSVMNGFESIITNMYNSFNPDIKIEAAIGKTIDMSDFPIEHIKKTDGVYCYSETIEENALLKYKTKQQIVTIKGVDNNFIKVSGIASKVVEGKYFSQNANNFMLFGYGIYDIMDIQLTDFTNSISVFIPKRGNTISMDPSNAFNNEEAFPIGAFSIQQDFDTKYVLVPLQFARKLMDYDKEVTAIEIKVSEGKDIDKVISTIHKLLGDKYIIKNKYQQEELLYKVIKSEKFAIFIILSFIILIASFNMIGSLSMLIIEKKSDIYTLRSLGASNNLIKMIFLTEGLIISLFGAFLGMLLGGIISWVQQDFGIIKLNGSGTFIIDAYPVQLQFNDFIMVSIIVIAIGLFASFFPVNQIGKKISKNIEVDVV